MPLRGSKVYPKMITRRERAMLNLIAQGYRNKEIAGELHISEKTVTESQKNLMRKLNVPNVASVIDQALEKGLISIYEVLESRFSKRKPKQIEFSYVDQERFRRPALVTQR